MDDPLHLNPLRRSHPVQQEPDVWIKAARDLMLRCQHVQAKQLLDTVIHAHPDRLEARLGLAIACLNMDFAEWPEGLKAAR